MRQLQILFLGFLCSINMPSVFGGTTNNNTQEYKLENGLKLIVREDHRSPLAVVQVWYKVGGSFEHNGITGISHALEHMMFRGTFQHPQDEFTRMIAVNGGDQNAFTSEDFTAYFQELNTKQVALCLELEADRMANLALPKEAFDKEIQVVIEERRLRTEDNPEALTEERLMAAAHVSNPYHHPVVGWMNDLQNMTVEDLRAWYKSWYGPNNATIIVVGDVNKEEVFQWVQTYFGPLKPIEVPKLKPRKELSSIGKRRVHVEANATVPRLYMSYNVPSLITAADPSEPYALLVLLMALDGGNSSRFSRYLVRGNMLATHIKSWYSPFSLHETLLSFSANPTPEHTTAELEEAFLQQIAALQAEPLSPEELNRVKVNVIAQHTFGQDSMQEQAIELGVMESIGLGWQFVDTYPERIQAVTAEQLQKVAQKYLIPVRLTTAELTPLASGK